MLHAVDHWQDGGVGAPGAAQLHRLHRIADQCLDFTRCAAERCAARALRRTTAKPRPCSPARAASTAAFRARILVWKAIASITRDDVDNFLRRRLDAAHAVPALRAWRHRLPRLGRHARRQRIGLPDMAGAAPHGVASAPASRALYARHRWPGVPCAAPARRYARRSRRSMQRWYPCHRARWQRAAHGRQHGCQRLPQRIAG